MATIRLLGSPAEGPTAFDGQYIVEYDPTRYGFDPDGREMLAHIVTTPDREKAKQFATKGEAFETYRLSSGRIRPDGRPDRPLTAFTVEIDD